MIDFKDIRDVHLEIATLCNARCPWCPRNFWGFPFNGGYPETYLTLDQAKQIFKTEFLQQLDSIRINGNFGDIVMNPEGQDIVKYFRESNQNLQITINTNGGARKKEFWQSLANSNAGVSFALDGLSDTHSLYRQDTLWSTVIKNAKTFIKHGGEATWQFIEFDHNRHQIDHCRKLSKELGFKKFDLVDDGRNIAPVFDKKGNLSHVLGDYRNELSFEKLITSKCNDEILLEDIIDKEPCFEINCETQSYKSIYVAANGEVYPCCYTGLYPKTYGKGQYHQAANAQLIPLIKENNALYYPLEQCIQWFTSVEKSWAEDKYEQGRLVICDNNCGNC
jgi:MoaA/NifB/PqqE/SkfB family radical SAM enzyme